MKIPLCAYCKHFDPQRTACAAFPEQIPAAFLFGQKNHVLPANGDHGIQFEALDELPAGSKEAVERILEREHQEAAHPS